MDVLFSLALGVVVLMAILWYTRRSKSSLRLPPGPRPLPLVGNIFSIDTAKMHLTFGELSEKYGKIFKVSFLGEEFVVINDIHMLRKAIHGEEYAGVFDDRPDTFMGKYILFNSDISLARANMTTYTLRKMLHKGLKVFGEGVTMFEHQVSEELDRLVSEINSHIGKDFDISHLLKKSFANWMSCLLTGKEAETEDSKIIWDFVESIVLLGTAGEHYLMTRIPLLRFLPGRAGRLYRYCIRARDRVLSRFYDLNGNGKYAFTKEAHGLTAVLIQMQQEYNQRAGFEVVSDLRGLILDMFAAGIDTTLTILVNTFALLLKYPECSNKIRAEIDRVTRNSRPPSLDDRPSMPYTKALILEVHRYISLAPTGIPHVCNRDVVFESYNIRKGSVIFPNLWYIHHDKKYWHDPWEFRPERFLDATGELLPADHELRQACIPFSIGRRSCPGQTLAMTRTFLYLTRILQEFEVKPPSSGIIPNVDPRCYKPSALLNVGEYLCTISPRNTSDRHEC